MVVVPAIVRLWQGEEEGSGRRARGQRTEVGGDGSEEGKNSSGRGTKAFRGNILTPGVEFGPTAVHEINLD